MGKFKQTNKYFTDGYDNEWLIRDKKSIVGNTNYNKNTDWVEWLIKKNIVH